MTEQNVTSITDEDIAIVSLKALITNLNLQINQLTSQISDFSDAARNDIKMRNRVSAMRSLRSKKIAEQSLARKLSNTSLLVDAYDRIEQAVDQVALIAAMKSTTQVLHSLHSGINDVQNVDSIMEELQTEIAKSDCVSDAMKEVGREANADDDEAIDAELEVLLHNANLNDDNKQAQDVATKLDSINAIRERSPFTQAQAKSTPAAAVSTLALRNQGILWGNEY